MVFRKLLFWLFAICTLMPTTSVMAEEYMLSGRGVNSCQGFLNDSVRGSKWDYIYFQWAEGYMSALNVRNQERVGQFVNLEPNEFDGLQRIQYLKNWCSENPDKPFVIGVGILYDFLRSLAQ
jgi:hypothetical protein